MPGITRRQFGRRGMLAVAAGGLATAGAAWSLPHPAQSASPPQTAPASPDDRETEARWQNALAVYGSRLDDAQKQRLRTIIAGNLRLLAPVRAFPLTNADPSQTVLKPVGLGAPVSSSPRPRN